MLLCVHVFVCEIEFQVLPGMLNLCPQHTHAYASIYVNNIMHSLVFSLKASIRKCPQFLCAFLSPQHSQSTHTV